MTDTIEGLRKKIGQAEALGSVVKTMKTLAALNIRQYEDTSRGLGDYFRTVELGLYACFQQSASGFNGKIDKKKLQTIIVVFGSDQGLVGQFNDLIADTVSGSTLLHAESNKIFLSVGERIKENLYDRGTVSEQQFTVPNSVNAITPLIGQLLSEIEHLRGKHSLFELLLFHNRPVSSGTFEPVSKRLLPLDNEWELDIYRSIGKWPGKAVPEIPNGLDTTRWALVREYLFISMFRACAESLAAENASRLNAMQRAEKNIDELLDELTRRYNQRRQAGIDEELFDVVAGFQAMVDSR
jgi:F-type H+-transporting ATPase subunit gamma